MQTEGGALPVREHLEVCRALRKFKFHCVCGSGEGRAETGNAPLIKELIYPLRHGDLF